MKLIVKQNYLLIFKVGLALTADGHAMQQA